MIAIDARHMRNRRTGLLHTTLSKLTAIPFPLLRRDTAVEALAYFAISMVNVSAFVVVVLSPESPTQATNRDPPHDKINP